MEGKSKKDFRSKMSKKEFPSFINVEESCIKSSVLRPSSITEIKNILKATTKVIQKQKKKKKNRGQVCKMSSSRSYFVIKLLFFMFVEFSSICFERFFVCCKNIFASLIFDFMLAAFWS